MIQATPTAKHGFVEEVELRGHIIDSLILPKVLDEILTRGASYVLKDIRVGQHQTDPSYARIEVRADSAPALQEILDAIHDHGAAPSSGSRRMPQSISWSSTSIHSPCTRTWVR